MHIKLLVSAAAIVLVAGLGSASAADQFTTMEGIEAKALTPLEMAAVFGASGLTVNPPFAGAVSNPPDAPPHLGSSIGSNGESIFGIGEAANAGTLPVVDISP